MTTVEVESSNGNLHIHVDDGTQAIDMTMGITRDSTRETKQHGIYGYSISEVAFDGVCLYLYADPDQWWSRRTRPRLVKEVYVHDGVDSGDWLIHDVEYDEVPPPEEIGEVVWRSED